MIAQMPETSIPVWLKRILVEEKEITFSWEQILKDSLYYPASGLNGTPAKFLSGNVYSFVYSDYGIARKEFLDDVTGSGSDCGFKYCYCVFQKELPVDPIIEYARSLPLQPRTTKAFWKEDEPFAYWSVWKREHNAPSSVGPEGFSFVFLAYEMSSCYQSLYDRFSVPPKVLAIIQPGGGFGDNWENPESDDSFFKRVIFSNHSGLPEYLLYGGFGGAHFYEEACWSEYKGERLIQLPERYAGLWRLNL